MDAVKHLLRPVLHALGYDIRKLSHVGLDAVTDIKAMYERNTPRIVFDVGAHLGETATVLAKAFPTSQIHSFEPSPETFARLQQHVSAWRNVKPVNAALGSSGGISTLNINQFGATNSLLRGAEVEEKTVADLMRPVKTVEVTVRTLDDYCQQEGINFVDLLKMDVQGFEIEVLHGARTFLANSHIALIYSEVSFELFYESQPVFEDVYREITKNGFQLVDLYNHVRSPVKTTRWCDALFVHPIAFSKRLEEQSYT